MNASNETAAEPIEAVAAQAEVQPQQTLADQFGQQYRVVCQSDLDSIRIERRRTSAYFELGRLAAALQTAVGYGNWGTYLKEHDYVERTISRALRIYNNLKDHADLCIGLTLREAEKFGEELTKVAEDEALRIEESVARSKSGRHSGS